MDSVTEELAWRGMLHDATEGAAEHLAEAPRTVYIGFDPTASSLHVGNLVPIMGLVHMQRAGHTPVALVGGGTGLIGDPSGRTAERQLLTKDDVAANADGIRAQLEQFLDFDAPSNAARMLNNLEWLADWTFLDFLRDVGKHFSMNQLLAKESVKSRLGSDSGLSFTEFSYALLQSYDFLELYRRHGVTVQAGGSDQWGNITAGSDLIRRVDQGKAFGIVFPLVTNSQGAKFGKSQGENVWLDPERTSPYRFYQFWVNTDDADVVAYLKMFTLLSREEIGALEQAVAAEPFKRAAQKALAEDVTRRVHGAEGLARALQATEALFGGDLAGLGADDLADIFADVPSSEVSRDALAGDGTALVDLLETTDLASSKGDARRAIEGGGMYVNNVRVEDVDHRVRSADALEGRFVVLRKGKKRYHVVSVGA